MASPLETLLLNQFMLFTFVLGRVSGLVFVAPILSNQGMPMRVRALFAVALSILITPLFLGSWQAPAENLLDYARLMGSEILVGSLIGVGLTILFSGIQVAGQIVAQLSGMSLADVFSPGFDSNVSVFSQLLYFLTMAVFLAMGGHRMFIDALLETFFWVGPGEAALGDTYMEALTTILSQSFTLGIRAAAPVMTALLVATLIVSLIGRTLPQINILAIGFGVNSLLTIAGLMLSLGTCVWVFQDNIADTIYQLQEAMRPPLSEALPSEPPTLPGEPPALAGG